MAAAIDCKMTSRGGGWPMVVDLDDDDAAVEVVPTSPAKSAAWTENLLVYLESKRADVSKLIDDDDDELLLVTPSTKLHKNNNNYSAAEVVVIDDSDGSYSEIFDVDDDDDDDVEVVSDSSVDGDFSSVLHKLGSVSVEQVKKLIESASDRLRSSLVGLNMMGIESRASQMCAGLAPAYSELGTGNLKEVEKEQNNLLRLLVQIKKRHPNIFTPEQIKQLNEVGRPFEAEKQLEENNHALLKPVCPSNQNVCSENIGQPTQQRISRSVDSLRGISSNQEKYGQNLLPSNRLPTQTSDEEFKDEDKHSSRESSESAERSRKRNASTFEGRHEQVPGVTVGFKKKAKDRDPRLHLRSEMEKISRSEAILGVRGSNSSKLKTNEELTQGHNSLTKQKNRTLDAKNIACQPCKRVDPIQNAKMEIEKLLNGKNNSVIQPGVNRNSKNGVRAIQIPEQVAALDTHEGQPLILNDKMEVEKLFNGDNSIQRAGVDGNSKAVGRLQFVAAAQGGQQFVATTTQKAEDCQRISVEKTQLADETSATITLNDVPKIHGRNRDTRHIFRQNVAKESRNLVSEKIKSNGHLVDSQSSKAISAEKEQGKSNKNNLPADSMMCLNLMSESDHGIQSQMRTLPSALNISEPTFSESQMNNFQTVPGLPNSSEPNSCQFEKNSLDFGSCLNARRGVPDYIGEGLANDASSSYLWGNLDHLLDGFDDQQKAVIYKERARRIEEQNKLFTERKLCLVLDLDHTLLNSVNFDDLEPAHEEMLRRREQQETEKPQRHLFRLPQMRLWTKLRPGIWNFLEKASKLYELHVSTMGTCSYANEMTKLLDPTGVLFADRVMSRGDDHDVVDKIKDLDGVMGIESAVLIIDDTAKVWPHHKPNLINVERYMYFPSSRRQFGLLGPSLFEIDRDEREADGTLASALAVIERIHRIFFSHKSLHEVDVRRILATEQRKVLAGCKILFSRVIPVGTSNPHMHPIWQLAEQFGALCTNQIDEQVTHVVATSTGTDKVNWALATGRFVVRPNWIEASAFLNRRANEKHFALKIKTKAVDPFQAKTNKQTNKKSNINTNPVKQNSFR